MVLGDVLLEADVLTKRQLSRALAMQEAGDNRKLGEILVELGYITLDDLTDIMLSNGSPHQDRVTVELEETKQLVGKDLDKHIKILDKKMLDYAAKLEFEDAARLRDEINRLKSLEVGIPKKLLRIKN